MNLDNHRHRARRPAATGLVTLVLAVGAVTKLFGLEAGLLAVVLAVVALVVAPHAYHSTPLPPSSPPHESDAPPDHLPPATRLRPLNEIPPFSSFSGSADDQDPDPDPDPDRSIR